MPVSPDSDSATSREESNTHVATPTDGRRTSTNNAAVAMAAEQRRDSGPNNTATAWNMDGHLGCTTPQYGAYLLVFFCAAPLPQSQESKKN
jgi:hypothetical protein